MTRRRRSGLLAWLVFLCLASCAASAGAQERQLVLVCATDSPLATLSGREARSLFLGVPTVRNGLLLRPLRNASDPLTTEVFLQHVIFMSRRNYERKLLHRVFRLGGTRPAAYTEIEELMAALRRSPEAVTYLWQDQLAGNEGVKSIGVLWQGVPN